MKALDAKLTKREKLHYEDMKKELARLVKAQKELRTKKNEWQTAEASLNKDISEFLTHYLEVKKESAFSMVELLDRALK